MRNIVFTSLKTISLKLWFLTKNGLCFRDFHDFRNVTIKNYFLAIGLVCISGCSPQLGTNYYNAKELGKINETQKGFIVSSQPIVINTTNGQVGAGALVGGGAGALAGAVAGKCDKNSVWLALAGGLLGAIAGNAVEQSQAEQQGMSYQVQLDNREFITIAQGGQPVFSVGQRVAVVKNDGGISRLILDSSPVINSTQSNEAVKKGEISNIDEKRIRFLIAQEKAKRRQKKEAIEEKKTQQKIKEIKEEMKKIKEAEAKEKFLLDANNKNV